MSVMNFLDSFLVLVFCRFRILWKAIMDTFSLRLTSSKTTRKSSSVPRWKQWRTSMKTAISAPINWVSSRNTAAVRNCLSVWVTPRPWPSVWSINSSLQPQASGDKRVRGDITILKVMHINMSLLRIDWVHHAFCICSTEFTQDTHIMSSRHILIMSVRHF